MATNLVSKMGQNHLPPLHLSLCHSETEWDIALRIRALIAPLIALDRVKNCENRFSSFGDKVG